jgi:carotene biosynthesis associated membrane protein
MSLTPTLNGPVTDERIERYFRIALYVFAGSIAFSLAGTLLLRLFPSLMPFFAPMYQTLVKAPTWTYMALLPVLPVLMYGPSSGWARIGLFLLWGSLIGGMSELAGTTTGLPFGEYLYTHWLGPKILGHVPYFIPLSWFAMSIVSLDLAGRCTNRRYERILVGALFMTLWDVSLDPAMTSAFPFWVYPGGGFYYGMPFSNWIGWLLVSLIIVWGYEALGGGLRKHSKWAPTVYLLNCLFPLGMCAIYGMWPAVVIGAIATAIPLLAAYAGTRSVPNHSVN